jgi:hypothetical protein
MTNKEFKTKLAELLDLLENFDGNGLVITDYDMLKEHAEEYIRGFVI